jgi:hypothetical protein
MEPTMQRRSFIAGLLAAAVAPVRKLFAKPHGIRRKGNAVAIRQCAPRAWLCGSCYVVNADGTFAGTFSTPGEAVKACKPGGVIWIKSPEAKC